MEYLELIVMVYGLLKEMMEKRLLLFLKEF